MQLVRVVQLLLLFLGSSALEACANEPIVRTQNGDVRGVVQGQVESFKALPYAAPPIGTLRWMPPQEPENWTGVRDASKFSHECPQTRPGPARAFAGNEDCLYLNVFKPSGANALAVIVFIHGGSNVRGSASQTGIDDDVYLYDGSGLAQKNVVVVTLNYRLGTLGLIGHPKLSATSGYGGSGNYTYMDQIQALKWVQRNIAAFGGDPGNVTLLGQSAGAKSVWVHMTSPLSKNLFHRAIVHSAVREGANTQEFAHEVGKELSKNLNCSNARDELELACMRGKSAKEVVNAMPSGPGSGKYGAVVDGHVLGDIPIAIMKRGEHHHVAILQGNVADEMSILGLAACGTVIDGLTCPRNISTEENYKQAVERYAASIEGASASDLLRLYPSSEYPSRPKAYNAIRADREYICPARRVLRAISAKQTEFVGRFFYTHTYSSGPHGPPPATDGASHGYELLFIFDSLRGAHVTPIRDELALVKTFQDTWSSFARAGTAPANWTRYDVQKDNHLVFDSTLSERDHLRTTQCDYWDTLRAP